MAGLILEEAGRSSTQGSRPTQQDRSMMLLPEKFPKGGMRGSNSRALFIICDGHGSSKASKHAIETVPQLIINHSKLAEENYEEVVGAAIRDEEALLYDLYCRGEDKLALVGSTISACLLDLTSGILTVGNLGDSPILLGEVNPAEPTRMHVNCISRVHKPASPREKDRIEVAGGWIDMQGDTPRIGGLNMSRALGDLQQKNPLNNTGSQAPRKSSNDSNGDYFSRGNVLSGEPTVKSIQLSDDRRYLLALTSDGVSDAIDDEKLLSSITTLWRSGENATHVSEVITGVVAPHERSDNATCAVAFLRGHKLERDERR